MESAGQAVGAARQRGGRRQYSVLLAAAATAGCCLPAAGRLSLAPALLTTRPSTTCSFSDLELTGSGSATSWLGCDLLMDVEEEEFRWGQEGS